MPRFEIVTRVLFWGLSIIIALVSLRFLALGLADAFPFLAYHIEERRLAFVAHVTLAPVALIVMPFQFSRRLRARRPGVHRWTGRAYGLAVLLSGIGGLLMVIGTQSGRLAALGFGLLAVFWLATTAMGVTQARARNLTVHRQWMIRSAALTFAAVTLRLYLPMLPVLGVEFQAGYVAVAWLCWVPNLMVAEWIIRRRRPAPDRPLVA